MSNPITPNDLYPEEFPAGKSEYGYGKGLVPPGLENAPPSEGGMYRPKHRRCSRES